VLLSLSSKQTKALETADVRMAPSQMVGITEKIPNLKKHI